jgi:hypothetical protein
MYIHHTRVHTVHSNSIKTHTPHISNLLIRNEHFLIFFVSNFIYDRYCCYTPSIFIHMLARFIIAFRRIYVYIRIMKCVYITILVRPICSRVLFLIPDAYKYIRLFRSLAVVAESHMYHYVIIITLLRCTSIMRIFVRGEKFFFFFCSIIKRQSLYPHSIINSNSWRIFHSVLFFFNCSKKNSVTLPYYYG